MQYVLFTSGVGFRIKGVGHLNPAGRLSEKAKSTQEACGAELHVASDGMTSSWPCAVSNAVHSEENL